MAQTKKRITKTARDNNTNYASGRRKKSIAHVWFAEGKGKLQLMVKHHVSISKWNRHQWYDATISTFTSW